MGLEAKHRVQAVNEGVAGWSLVRSVLSQTALVCTLSLVAICLLIIPGQVQAQEQDTRSKRAMALECSVLYEVLARYGNVDEEGQHRLESQASLMNSMYLLSLPGVQSQRVSMEQINMLRREIVYNLLVMSEAEPDVLIDRAIDCEGWREEIVVHLYRQTEARQGNQQEILRRAPDPGFQYQLPDNVTRLDVGLEVESAFGFLRNLVLDGIDQ